MRNYTPGMKFYRSPDAEGAGSGGAPAAATTTENPTTATTSDILSTLKHDPFPGGKAPEGDKPAAKAAAKPKAADAAKGAGAKGATVDGSENAEPTTITPVADPEKEALRQSNQLANELLEHYKTKGATGEPSAPAGGKAAAPASSTPAAGETPSYAFNIPDQLVTALTSDDPVIFKQGVAGFAQGIGQGVHKQVVEYMTKQMPSIIEKLVPAIVQSQMQSTNSKQAIFNDFYGTYKELNNPKLYPVIGQITSEVMRDLKTTSWSPAVRDTVAKKVKEFIVSIGGQLPRVEAPAAKAAHPITTLSGGNSSRAGTEVQDPLAQDIMDTLFTGQG